MKHLPRHRTLATLLVGLALAACDDSDGREEPSDLLETSDLADAAADLDPDTDDTAADTDDGADTDPGDGADGSDDDDDDGDAIAATCGDGVLDADEVCDTAIAAGQPGACPDATSCVPADACESAALTGAACQLTCVTAAVTACQNGDGCCPSGCNAADDDDCTAACGNGVLEPGEKCDTTATMVSPAACPTSCTAEHACETASLTGSGCLTECVSAPLTACQDADGCCPNGCTSATDDDCSPLCGNGTLDTDEACDTGIAAGQPGACPSTTSCVSSSACDQVAIVGGSCDAVCELTVTETCQNGDGCCPSGCNAGNDNDCSATCGNGVLEPGERCDTAIGSGAGECPNGGTCSPATACESAQVSGSACQAECVRGTVAVCRDGDGCCPTAISCTEASDDDCPAVCGNGVVETGEQCDEVSMQCNLGSCTWVATGTALVINEFRTGPTHQEALELYNPGSSAVSLDGWSVRHTDEVGTVSYALGTGHSVSAGGFFVLLNSHYTTGPAANVSHYKGAGAVLELLDAGGTVVDRVGYGLFGDAPAPIFSHTSGRVGDGLDTGDDALDFNMDPFPTLGSANDVTAVTLGATDVVINEFLAELQDPNGDFVELYNKGTTTVDLRDWIVIFGTDEHIFGAGSTLAPGAHLVLTEANFPPFSSAGMANPYGTMYLFKPGWVRVQQLTYGSPADGPISTNGTVAIGYSPDGDVTAFRGVTHASQGLCELTPSPSGNNGVCLP